MAVDAATLKNFVNLPIPKFNPKSGQSFSSWIKCYELIMCTKDEQILKYCMLYYLSEELLQEELLHKYPKATYSSLKSYMKKMCPG